MFYSILVQFTQQNGKSISKKEVKLIDETSLNKIIKEIIKPYLNNESFIMDGYILDPSMVSRIKIVESEQSINDIFKIEQFRLQQEGIVNLLMTPRTIIDDPNHVKDITSEVLNAKPLKTNVNSPDLSAINSNKVFIVHGRDDAMKIDVTRFLEKVKLVPIILHEQPNQGKTLIEKIEEYTDVGYGIVLYTPCDKGGLANENFSCMKYRARQNVVFEHGYLIGRLGRNKVCALMKDNVEYPNDISGILYIAYQNNNWKFELARELKKAGFKVDMNDLV